MFQPQGQVLLGTVTLLTALGFFQIGFDNGLMGGLVSGASFNASFDTPSPTIIGLIVAILEVGAFFGSLFTAFYGEQLGRRKSVGLGVIVMIIGSTLQATAYSRTQLIIARVVSGIGLGAINSTVPVLQAEFSPKATRGRFVCAQLSTLNFGTAFVYWVDYAFSSHIASYAWRIPVILQCFFLFPMLFILLLIPETPRWLASHDRPDEALLVLQRLRSGKDDDAAIRDLHRDILKIAAQEAAIGAGSWKDLSKNDHIQSQRRFLIACAIQTFQQLGGINAIICRRSSIFSPVKTPILIIIPPTDYSGTLFQSSIGFSPHMSALMSGFLQTWFFVASFIPWLLIDRIGRRPLLLSMISLMALVLAVQAALIYQVQHHTSVAHAAGIGAAAMLFVFEGAFTIGFQATVWVYPSEILPLRLRQRGSSMSTAANWIFNYTVVQITPPAIANIGWRTYVIFAVLNAAWVPVIYVYFPETKGLELEDVDRLFAGEDLSLVDERAGGEKNGDVRTVERVGGEGSVA